MKPRVLFLSASDIAIPCLETLYTLYNAGECASLGLVTHAARPRGRGQQYQLNPIAAWANEKSIDCYPTEKMDEAAVSWCQNARPDLIFVMAFGHILKTNVLQMAPLGIWNFHTSLLPKYRGASPIQSCLLAGEQETGVSLMQVVEALDAGPWIDQSHIPIGPSETTLSLSQKLAQSSAQLLQKNWETLIQKTYTLCQQNESKATFTHKFRKEDGLLDFHEPAEALERKIRAFTPWPGTFFYLKDLCIKVHAAHVLPDTQTFQPGQWLINEANCTLGIRTSNHILALDQLQRPGGKILSAREFINGNQSLWQII